MTKKKVPSRKLDHITAFKNKKWTYIKVAGAFMLLIVLGLAWHYRVGIKYYIHTWGKSLDGVAYKDAKYDIRNVEIMTAHADKIFGIDISQYQDKINWVEVNTINDQFPIDFIFVRATMGERKVDDNFDENWKSIATRANLRGAYHYFRPNENSVKQAKNFIKTVKLKPGDLPPVLDIEEMPKHQPMDSLKVGLKRWLDEVETHYKVKPILYSGDKFFTDFLQKEFSDYVIWIANYNFWVEDLKDHWDFWQFSEKGTVRGIKGNVDLNIFNGDIEELEELTIPFKN
ncbi:glycoside hydrolase family 25 protein [Sphingobacterium sp. SRCM116780]|uniref:glycoside hydrolase family 25 protein n=1 Tax=Sphingobacterium sp. SRCM116780 TaxID=2907623 RepID=UPI001F39E19E|nr:glycoside hydrolase family 25 protein [Sphingobacterium sp. SRCM116780]UIR56723.1 glycoside hydrolase family 25 protein [Sphingobacterium sp. SRCM116780]